MKFPKLITAKQAVLTEWQAKLAKELAAQGSRTTTTGKNIELGSRIAKEIAKLEEDSDPDDLKAASSHSEKSAQLVIVNRRLENAEVEEAGFVRGGKMRGLVSELEEILRGIAMPVYEQHLAEITAGVRPFFREEASALQAARNTDFIHAWGGWLQRVSTCCTLAGQAEVAFLLQSIEAMIEGQLPFAFSNGHAVAA